MNGRKKIKDVKVYSVSGMATFKGFIKNGLDSSVLINLIVVFDSEFETFRKKGFTFPLAIIAGNETEGLPKEVLNEVDIIVELPMFGINRSFNVWGSTAVIAYKILENL